MPDDVTPFWIEVPEDDLRDPDAQPAATIQPSRRADLDPAVRPMASGVRARGRRPPHHPPTQAVI